LPAAQEDLRGEAIERNEAYKSFSAAGKSRNLDKNIIVVLVGLMV